jgi:hypothetical protein
MNKFRRDALKMGAAALAMIPVIALAAKNEGVRKSMQYQDTPKDGKKCSACAQFVAGKSAKENGCKVFPNDTEVAADGWCIAFAPKA